MTATVIPLRPGARFSLLVVDTDPIARLQVSDALRAAGYRVLEATSASDAEAVLTGIPVHCVVLNTHLGDSVDTLAVARLAADLRPPPKLILADAAVAEDDSAEGLRVRTDGAAAQLVEVIRKTLDSAGAAGS